MAEIPSKTRNNHRRRRRQLAGVLAKLILIAAIGVLLAGILLLTAWWRLITWPQRHANPRERTIAQREALLELVTAAGTLIATRKTTSAPANEG